MSTELYMFCEDIPGIHELGEKTDFKPDRTKFIKLESMEHQISRPAADIRPSAFGGGHRVGQIEHGTIIARKWFDPTSISILKAFLGKQLLKEVRIFGSRVVEREVTSSKIAKITGGLVGSGEATHRRPVLEIRLDNVLITNFQYAITPAEAEEQIELRYSSISWTVRTVRRGDESLAGGEGQQVKWDGETNESSGGMLPFSTTADELFARAGF